MPQSLIQHVMTQLAPWRQAPSWCVAFSGGLDSTVLLHALVQAQHTHQLPPLRALYIHHGLQQAAEAWPAHCAAQCRAWGVPLEVVTVAVQPHASIEQAARAARYEAFSAHLQPDEVLCMAQHQDDQAETLLFRLLRGTGVAGLQGIPAHRALGVAQVVRPLLQRSKQQLYAYAQAQQLDWVEDPSNDADDFDRNFLRRQIIPALKQRWPGLLTVLQRTSEHMREAQALLDELAQQDLEAAQQQPLQPVWLALPSLDLTVLRGLSEARQKNALRVWLRAENRSATAAHWQGWRALREAKADAQPQWRLDNGVLVRYQQRVYFMPPAQLTPPPAAQLTVAQTGEYSLPSNGRLQLMGALKGPLSVGYRQGGETLQLAQRGRRDLKRLLQERQVPWFVRERIPLLRSAGEVVAVANYPELTAEGWQQVRCVWSPAVATPLANVF